MGREIKRVEADFSWPLGKVWEGFVNPYAALAIKCTVCDGRGDTPAARQLHDLWWGYLPFRPEEKGCVPLDCNTPEVRAFAEYNVGRTPGFYGAGEESVRREADRLAGLWNSMWQHHLSQEEIDHLWAGGMLKDFAEKPTTEQVSRWSLTGIDNPGSEVQWALTQYYLHEEKDHNCAECDGHGEIWEDEADWKACEIWQPKEPPSGDWWQLWETVSEGSPVTPAFSTSEGLVQHLIRSGDWSDERRGDGGWSEQAARQMIDHQWAPSLIIANGVSSTPRDGQPI